MLLPVKENRSVLFRIYLLYFVLNQNVLEVDFEILCFTVALFLNTTKSKILEFSSLLWNILL